MKRTNQDTSFKDDMNLPSAHHIRDAMFFSSRTARRIPQDAVMIHRGAWLPTALLHPYRAQWQLDHIVSIARTWAVLSSRPSYRAAGLSATLLCDLPVISAPEQIHLVTATVNPSKPTVFPAIQLNNRVIAAETTTHLHRQTSWPIPAICNSALTDQAALGSIILSCCALHSAEDGFVATCSALRRLAIPDGDRRHHHAGVETRFKAQLLADIEQLPAHTPYKEQARWIVVNAEAGCESVGEARLLWLLRSSGIRGTCVQHLVTNGYERYYLDIAIADLKIAIEFDGRGKYGITEEERAVAWGDQFDRQQFLEERGWLVCRFTWADLEQPEKILAEVRATIERRRSSARF